ncbi:MAG TPA: hypothetical protein VNZ94_00555 [Xanthobacteraceae bacterium]|nr:hypothetical protein [Xanthobacteraceae bacterium]
MTTEPKIDEDRIEVFNAQDDDANTGASINPPPEQNTPDEPERTETKIVPVDDGGRSAIADKFKRIREDREKPVEAHGDYTDPSQLYGQHAAAPEAPQPDATTEPSPPPAERKFKLTVRGEEREVTEQELLTLAQKSAAADSYLDDARHILETAKQRVKVSRQHPADPPRTDATEFDELDDQQHQADPFEHLVEQMQYGDPKDVSKNLRTTMAEIAKDAVKEATTTSRVQQDLASDLRAYDEFVKANPELANDRFAVAGIRDSLLEGYREDLRKIGVSEDHIPKDPEQLAIHHRHYKLQGHPVRTVPTLLEGARQDFIRWRGNPKEPSTTMPRPEARVDVRVNRDERRMAINHQPTRATVAPQMQQPPAGAGKTRADAVAAARRARGQV